MNLLRTAMIWSALALTVASGCSEESGIQEVGRFRVDDKVDIRIYSFLKSVTPQQVREHPGLSGASAVLNQAYYYPVGAAIPNQITNESDILTVMADIYEEPRNGNWSYAKMKTPKTGYEFVDCVDRPLLNLCRQK